MIQISTRSYIAKKIGEDAYLTIYCHADGYVKYLSKEQLESAINENYGLSDEELQEFLEKSHNEHSAPRSSKKTKPKDKSDSNKAPAALPAPKALPVPRKNNMK